MLIDLRGELLPFLERIQPPHTPDLDLRHITIFKYLQKGLNKRKASVLRIFREWDEISFPDTDPILGANGNGGDDAEKQMQDAMDLLNADEEEVPDEAA
ncbi:hypothetical protein DFH09DRAFT_1338128 [Mycena vulgaris]|nr:hypothetical protein DFH09DRAFT_1338128 [Mycena vulgaris]